MLPFLRLAGRGGRHGGFHHGVDLHPAVLLVGGRRGGFEAHPHAVAQSVLVVEADDHVVAVVERLLIHHEFEGVGREGDRRILHVQDHAVAFRDAAGRILRVEDGGRNDLLAVPDDEELRGVVQHGHPAVEAAQRDGQGVGLSRVVHLLRVGQDLYRDGRRRHIAGPDHERVSGNFVARFGQQRVGGSVQGVEPLQHFRVGFDPEGVFAVGLAAQPGRQRRGGSVVADLHRRAGLLLRFGYVGCVVDRSEVGVVAAEGGRQQRRAGEQRPAAAVQYRSHRSFHGFIRWHFPVRSSRGWPPGSTCSSRS